MAEVGGPWGYASPKATLLSTLKRRGELSLRELAETLHVSRVAALRHLVALEGERLVTRRYAPAGVGRPRAIFRLTERAAVLFPQAYAQIGVCALEFIEE